MYKYFTLILWLLAGTAMAQQSSVQFFSRDTLGRNAVGVDFSYQNTLGLGIGYTRIACIKKHPLALQANISTPLLLAGGRNKDFHVSAATYILRSRFNLKTRLGLSMKLYDDVLARGEAMYVHVGLYPGYYGRKFFVAAEMSYRNNIFTTFKFKEAYTQGRNAVLMNANGEVTMGLNMGVLVCRKLEINARVFYFTSRDFRNYPPYTQNIGASLGIQYMFPDVKH